MSSKDNNETKKITKRSFFFRLIGTVLLFFLLDFILSAFLLSGLEKYYGLNSNSKVALIGHSHLMLGIDKEKLEKELGVSVAKYTREGVNVADRKVMVEQLINSNKNVQTIIYGVDAWSFTSEGLSANSYGQFYPFLNLRTIDDFIKNNASFADYWTKKIIRTTRFDEVLLSSAVRGHLGKWTNLKYGNVHVENLKRGLRNDEYRKVENRQENIAIFKETIRLALKNDMEVVLLYVPTIDLLEKVQQESFDEAISIFEQIAKEKEGVEFLNLQDSWSHEYELFYDPIHLNPKGQKTVTDSVAKYLHYNQGYLKK